MKKILIISYTNLLNADSKIPIILDAQSNFRKLFASTWLIATTESSSEFFKKIEASLDKDNDRIIISEITKDHQGWISRKIWDWVKENQ